MCFEWEEPVDQDKLRERELVTAAKPREAGRPRPGRLGQGRRTQTGACSGRGAAVHGASSLSGMGGEAGSSGAGRPRGSGKLDEAPSGDRRAGVERCWGRDSGPQRARGAVFSGCASQPGSRGEGAECWDPSPVGVSKAEFWEGARGKGT